MLTDTLIRKARTPDKPKKLMDGRGLFMLLTPSGGRWWRFRYAFAGKEKLVSFGIYPDVSLKDAREAREDARKLLAKGIDPSAARQEERRAQREAADNDFETIAREWLENVKPGWAAVYHGDTLKRFETFVFPTISRHPIASVTAPVLLSLLRKIEARGTLVTAHKADIEAVPVGPPVIRMQIQPAADLGFVEALQTTSKVGGVSKVGTA